MTRRWRISDSGGRISNSRNSPCATTQLLFRVPRQLTSRHLQLPVLSLLSLNTKSPVLLNHAIREYLSETKNHKWGKTYAAYRTTLYLFSPGADENDSCTGASRWLENIGGTEVVDRLAEDLGEGISRRGASVSRIFVTCVTLPRRDPSLQLHAAATMHLPLC
jgi:hypothetical protein